MKNSLKILLCMIFVLLTACSSKPEYYLYVYYAKTCPICKSFQENVIPVLEDKYGKSMEIIQYDIDEESSIDAYAKTCSLLEDYYVDENSGNVPFIVLDGYFAKVGYTSGDETYSVDDIQKAVAGEALGDELSGLRFSYFNH